MDFWAGDVLGVTVFADGIIEVRQDGRYARYAEKMIIACRGENTEAADATCANDWEEWQADYFSACLLMPSVSVGVFIEPYLGKQDFALNGAATYPLSHLPMREQVSIVDDFMKAYGVSHQRYRPR